MSIANDARLESPFRSTIAHGFLTLSMIPWFLERTLAFEGGTMSLNYGLDRVRFIRPVLADSMLQGRFTLVGIDDQPWGWQLTWDAAVGDAGQGGGEQGGRQRARSRGPTAGPDAATGAGADPWQRPALVARWLTRWYR